MKNEIKPMMKSLSTLHLACPKIKRKTDRLTMSGGVAESLSIYAFLSSNAAGGSDGTVRTTSTQRFPSAATSTVLIWPPAISSSPFRVKLEGFGGVAEAEIREPLQLQIEVENGGKHAFLARFWRWNGSDLSQVEVEDEKEESRDLGTRRRSIGT